MLYLLINVTDIYGTFDLVSQASLPFAGTLDSILAVQRQTASLLMICRQAILNCKALQRVDCVKICEVSTLGSRLAHDYDAVMSQDCTSLSEHTLASRRSPRGDSDRNLAAAHCSNPGGEPGNLKPLLGFVKPAVVD